MLVSHRHKFIYTKTAKTGGTSVEVYFEPHCLPEGTWSFAHARDEYVGKSGVIGVRGKGKGDEWFSHMPADQIRQKVGHKIWNEYFKFCVIRDPYDKVVSAFHFFETRGKRDGQREGGRRDAGAAAFREGLHLAGSQRPVVPAVSHAERQAIVQRFRAWVREGNFVTDRDKYSIDGKVCIDYFIRYESLDAGVRHVCDVLGLPFESERIPHLKGGYRPGGMTLPDYYDAATIECVRNAYRFEVDHFGYGPPTAPFAAAA